MEVVGTEEIVMKLPKELHDKSWISSKEDTEEDRVILVRDVKEYIEFLTKQNCRLIYFIIAISLLSLFLMGIGAL